MCAVYRCTKNNMHGEHKVVTQLDYRSTWNSVLGILKAKGFEFDSRLLLDKLLVSEREKGMK